MFSEIINLLRAILKKRSGYMFGIYIRENKLTVNVFKNNNGGVEIDCSPIDLNKKSAVRKIKELSELIGTLPGEKTGEGR